MPLPKVLARTPKPEVQSSGALSLLARPGTEGIKTRRIAILVADGVDGSAALEMHEALAAQGAVPRFVGDQARAGAKRERRSARSRDLDGSGASVVWDAMIVPDGGAARLKHCLSSGHALEFLKDQYRHCKPILLMGAAQTLLDAAGIPAELPREAPIRGLLRFGGDEPMLRCRRSSRRWPSIVISSAKPIPRACS